MTKPGMVENSIGLSKSRDLVLQTVVKRIQEYTFGRFKEKYPGQLKQYLEGKLDRGECIWVGEELILSKFEMPSWQISPGELENHLRYINNIFEIVDDL